MKLSSLLIAFIFICNAASSQIILTEYTAYTLSRDTLWVKNEAIGFLIRDSWNLTRTINPENKPVIIMIDDLALVRKKHIIQKK